MIKYLLILLVIAKYGRSTTIFSENEEQDITDFVETVMDCKHMPGLSLTVVKNGAVWTKGFGFAQLKSKKKVTKDTVFPTASVGKTFTVVLLGKQLKETG